MASGDEITAKTIYPDRKLLLNEADLTPCRAHKNEGGLLSCKKAPLIFRLTESWHISLLSSATPILA